MEKDGAALLLLLFVLVLAMAGVALFVTGSSRRADRSPTPIRGNRRSRSDI